MISKEKLEQAIQSAYPLMAILRVSGNEGIGELDGQFYSLKFRPESEGVFASKIEDPGPMPGKKEVATMAKIEKTTSARFKTKARQQAGPVSESTFWTLVSKARDAGAVSQKQARHQVLKQHPEFCTLFRPEIRVRKDANPYQSAFFALCEDEQANNPELSAIEARGRVRAKNQQLFKAGFLGDPCARFMAAVALEHERGLTVDKAYQLVAQHLPSEATALKLSNLR